MTDYINTGNPLTARQTEFLALAAEGLQVAEIAARLHVSESTAKATLGELRSRLGAKNTAHAVAQGFRTGVLS